tara:strand:+ start:313 stop:450 length:138 start_codon:yes stop_codon:yes gene_type:complete
VGFLRGLLFVAGLANGLKVLVPIAATLRERNDMVAHTMISAVKFY